MNILLSNDDGYSSKRLQLLKEVFMKYGAVYVAAPSFERSGASVSLTIKTPVSYKAVEERTIAVDGTPADSVALGLAYYKDVNFDLVISGINYGINTSKDTLYSGTVGCIMMGAFAGIKSIAFSSGYEDDPSLKEKTEYIVDYIFKNNLLDKAPMLNVNIPDKRFIKGKGIKVAKLYPVPTNDYLEKTKEGYLQGRKLYFETLPEDSDWVILENGYYSLSAMKPSLEDEMRNEKLKEFIE